MVDFSDILNKPAAEVEKPKPRPTGTYLGTIHGMPDQRTAGDQPILSFKVKLIAPQDDVDREALADHPAVTDWPPMKRDIFISEPWELKKFLTETLGIDPGPEDNSKTLAQMVAEAPGKQLMATLHHRPYTDRDGQPAIATEIKGTAHV